MISISLEGVTEFQKGGSPAHSDREEWACLLSTKVPVLNSFLLEILGMVPGFLTEPWLTLGWGGTSRCSGDFGGKST